MPPPSALYEYNSRESSADFQVPFLTRPPSVLPGGEGGCRSSSSLGLMSPYSTYKINPQTEREKKGVEEGNFLIGRIRSEQRGRGIPFRRRKGRPLLWSNLKAARGGRETSKKGWRSRGGGERFQTDGGEKASCQENLEGFVG